jgi:hypothetical protein
MNFGRKYIIHVVHMSLLQLVQLTYYGYTTSSLMRVIAS